MPLDISLHHANVMVVNNFKVTPILREFIKSAVGSETNISENIVKSLELENNRRLTSSFYGVLVVKILKTRTCLKILCFIVNKHDNKHEYVDDAVIDLACDDLSSRIIAIMKNACEKVLIGMNEKILFVILEDRITIPKNTNLDFQIIMSPKIFLRSLLDIEMTEPQVPLSLSNRSAWNESLKNFVARIDELLVEIQKVSLSSAVHSIYKYLIDVDLPSAVLKKILPQFVEFMKGPIILSLLLHPKFYKVFDSLAPSNFRNCLSDNRWQALQIQQERDAGLVNIGFFISKSGSFQSLDYENPEFWNNAIIIAKYPELAIFASNLLAAPACCPEYDVSDFCRNFEPPFEPSAIKLYKILKLRDLQ